MDKGKGEWFRLGRRLMLHISGVLGSKVYGLGFQGSGFRV